MVAIPSEETNANFKNCWGLRVWGGRLGSMWLLPSPILDDSHSSRGNRRKFRKLLWAYLGGRVAFMWLLLSPISENEARGLGVKVARVWGGRVACMWLLISPISENGARGWGQKCQGR